VESGPVASLFAHPMHPYTRGLLSCVPVPGKVKRGDPLGSIPGMVPRVESGFTGCAFRQRCELARPDCAGTIPRRAADDGHKYLCQIEPALMLAE
jgi:peptide/nickel transport system ATP-binding protein